MKITAVETLRTELQPNLVVVALHTDAGIVGLGDAFYGARAVEAYLHESVAPLLIGMEDPSPELAARRLRSYVGYQGSGAETRGNGAVDLALWDLLGQRAGLPVTELLGGPAQHAVPAYNTCAGAAYISNEPRQAVANWGLDTAVPGRYEDLTAFLTRPGELAKDLWSEGFHAMKVWPFDEMAEQTNGNRLLPDPLHQGLGILDAIRTAVPEMSILVELHGLWNLPAAVDLVRELERFEPYWVEDPIRSDSVDAYRRLQSSTRVPIATGETLTGTRAFRSLLENDGLSMAIIDLGWTGGLTEARKIASLADSFDIPFAPHDCTGPISFAACVHLVTSQHNGLVQEIVRSFRRSWHPEIVDGLPDVVDGFIEAPSTPGLGVRLADGFRARDDVEVRFSPISFETTSLRHHGSTHGRGATR